MSAFPGLIRLVLCLQMVTKTKKIFVGGLSSSTTIDDVKNYFKTFGQVSAFGCVNVTLAL